MKTLDAAFEIQITQEYQDNCLYVLAILRDY